MFERSSFSYVLAGARTFESTNINLLGGYRNCSVPCTFALKLPFKNPKNLFRVRYEWPDRMPTTRYVLIELIQLSREQNVYIFNGYTRNGHIH
jgi:hypothetical protein